MLPVPFLLTFMFGVCVSPMLGLLPCVPPLHPSLYAQLTPGRLTRLTRPARPGPRPDHVYRGQAPGQCSVGPGRPVQCAGPERHGYRGAEVLITRFIPITENKHPRTARNRAAEGRKAGPRTLLIRAWGGAVSYVSTANILYYLSRPTYLFETANYLIIRTHKVAFNNWR